MKMSRVFLLAVFLLLLSGWVFFQVVNPGVTVDLGDQGFRSWFWEYRALDLVVQVVLVFGGAMGIAALLPGEDDDD